MKLVNKGQINQNVFEIIETAYSLSLDACTCTGNCMIA